MRTGRPKLPKEKVKSRQIALRLTEQEFKDLKAASERDEVLFCHWIKYQLMIAAKGMTLEHLVKRTHHDNGQLFMEEYKIPT